MIFSTVQIEGHSYRKDFLCTVGVWYMCLYGWSRACFRHLGGHQYMPSVWDPSDEGEDIYKAPAGLGISD